MSMNTTRVVLADDHAVVRAGLRGALSNIPGFEIVGEACNGPEVLAALEHWEPDLLVMDVAMPDFDPIAAIHEIRARYPRLKILVVSAYDDQAYVVGLLSAGVHGYHLKDQPLADLQLAAQRVMAGENWISGPLVSKLLQVGPSQPQKATPGISLTRRQRELLRLLAQGYDNRHMAQEMELSVKTIENHLTALYRAIGVSSRLEAYQFALRHPELLAISGQEALQAPPEMEVAASLAVLVVDDSERYRGQLKRMIGKACPEARIYEAEDCGEAGRLARQTALDLALIDVLLGAGDGIQCARRVKALSPQTRVILISAYPDREFRRLGLEAGAEAFLDKKDLDAATIRQVIEDVLGRKK